METLQDLKTAIIKTILGNQASISARVFRAATGKWEEQKVLASGYRGGLVEPFRILYRIITGTKPQISIKKNNLQK